MLLPESARLDRLDSSFALRLSCLRRGVRTCASADVARRICQKVIVFVLDWKEEGGRGVSEVAAAVGSSNSGCDGCTLKVRDERVVAETTATAYVGA